MKHAKKQKIWENLLENALICGSVAAALAIPWQVIAAPAVPLPAESIDEPWFSEEEPVVDEEEIPYEAESYVTANPLSEESTDEPQFPEEEPVEEEEEESTDEPVEDEEEAPHEMESYVTTTPLSEEKSMDEEEAPHETEPYVTTTPLSEEEKTPHEAESSVTPARFRLQNIFINHEEMELDDEELSAITAPILDKEITAQELNAAVDEITLYARENGYPVAVAPTFRIRLPWRECYP